LWFTVNLQGPLGGTPVPLLLNPDSLMLQANPLAQKSAVHGMWTTAPSALLFGANMQPGGFGATLPDATIIRNLQSGIGYLSTHTVNPQPLPPG
jgi:hypothetical protein